MGILETLLVIFITLKVLGLITWGWMTVLWPLWVMIVLYGSLLTLCLIAAVTR